CTKCKKVQYKDIYHENDYIASIYPGVQCPEWGFEYLVYWREMVESGQACILCRLLVCTLSTLHGFKFDDVDQHYRLEMPVLKQTSFGEHYTMSLRLIGDEVSKE